MPSDSTLDIERLIAYFRTSAFEYLALRHRRGSLTLQREPAAAPITVLAPSVGVIQKAAATERVARAGDAVRYGDALFSVRRFQSVVEVLAPASGRITFAHLDAGGFVEYGQALAVIDPD